MTPLVVQLALKSLVVVCAALLALRIFRGRSAAERATIAHSGVAALLALPLAALLLPRWTVEAPAAVAGPLTTGSWSRPTDAATGLATEPAGYLAASTALTAIDWLLVLYLCGAGTLLALTAAAMLRLHLLRREANVLVDREWLTALAQAQRRMGFKHGTALLVARRLASPVSWGFLRPVILLDARAVEARTDAEAIIAHELAHVARMDWLKLIAGRCATALFWFNPLVWILARKAHQLSEEAADEAVLASGVDGGNYARLLIETARHDSRGLLVAANGVAAGRGSLKRRILRVLDSGPPRSPASGPWGAAWPVGAVLLAAPLAAMTPSGIVGTPGLSTFAALELRGIAHIQLRHGATRRATIRSGHGSVRLLSDPAGTLLIQGCPAACTGPEPEVEIVLPTISRLTVDGAGTVQTVGRFPQQDLLVAQVNGPGLMRIGGLDVGRAEVAAAGGGTIKARVRDALLAGAEEGSMIVYWGDPAVYRRGEAGGVVVKATDD